MTPTRSQVATLLSRGLTIQEVADRFGLTYDQARRMIERYQLTRWDSGNVMCVEVAAQAGVSADDVITRARLMGIRPRQRLGVLYLTPKDARAVRAYYAQFKPAEEFTHWYTPRQAAARLGIRYVSLQQAMTRGTPWTAALRRVPVRGARRWEYRYDPASVEEVRAIREAK